MGQNARLGGRGTTFASPFAQAAAHRRTARQPGLRSERRGARLGPRGLAASSRAEGATRRGGASPAFNAAHAAVRPFPTPLPGPPARVARTAGASPLAGYITVTDGLWAGPGADANLPLKAGGVVQAARGAGGDPARTRAPAAP